MIKAKFKHPMLFAIVFALALVPLTQTADAADRSASCVDALSAKAASEIARLRSDYARIKLSDTQRSTDLKRLSLLRAMDLASREPFLHRCGSDLNSPALKPAAVVMLDADRWNQRQLKLILGRLGWPVISRYGAEADQTAFLIVQHATNDLSFQREILAKLEKLLAAKETGGENYALLYDRVHETEGRMQRFGTQGNCRGTTWISYPIEDAAGVDKRRTALGMSPLAEYNASAQKLYCRQQSLTRINH
jgi:hypothetical protein